MIYEYQCTECGFVDEKDFDPNEDRPLTITCSECNTHTMNRVFGNTVIHVPFQWTKDTYKFDKRPREKRRFK